MHISLVRILSCILLDLFLGCPGVQPASAQIPLGVVVSQLPYTGKMLADAKRQRIYLLQRDANEVISIDTASLTRVGTLPTGNSPMDLAITPKGDLLYVANDDPNEAIDLIGLDDFVEYNSFAFPRGLEYVAAGVGGRIFVSKFGVGNSFYQLDGSTGEEQARFTKPNTSQGFDEMRATPDGKNLMISSQPYVRVETGTLSRYDISKKKTVEVDSTSPTWGHLAISHDGRTVGVGALMSGSRPIPPNVYFFGAMNFGAVRGFYSLPYRAGPMAFSADDRVVYQTLESGNVVYLFDPNTFELLDTLPLPPVVDGSLDTVSREIAVDGSGSYLFVGQYGTAPDGKVIDQTLVIGTGRGSGVPTERATVDVGLNHSTVVAGGGGYASFLLVRGGDLSRPLTVAYTLGGSAVNGVDYQPLSGTKKIPAHKSSVLVRVYPAEDIGPDAKTVAVTLKIKPAYDIGDFPQATVTIEPRR